MITSIAGCIASSIHTSGGGATPLTHFLIGSGSFTQSTNNVTTTSGATSLVAANALDTTVSTLTLKTLEVGYGSNWTSTEIGFGLTTQNYGPNFNAVEIGFYVPASLVVYYKIIGGGETNSGYTLTAATTSKLRVRVTAGVTFWVAFFEVSTDSGATWTILNPGGTGITTAIAISSPLYGNLNGLDSTNIFNGIKGDA